MNDNTVRNNEEQVRHGLFPFGERNEKYASVFTGQSYLASLVADTELSVHVAQVSFEPGCRNFWHTHTDGFQILMVTAGEGWYQEDGQPARALKPGDVVVTHKGVRHWHGARKDSWFSHIAITSGATEFDVPVTDAEYDALPS